MIPERLDNNLGTAFAVATLPFLLSLLIGLTYGFQYLASDALGLYFAIVSLPFVLILLVLTWNVGGRWDTGSEYPAPPSWLGFALMSVSFTTTLFLFSRALQPVGWMPAVLGTVGVAWLCQWRWGARASTLAFVLAAFATYVLLVLRIPHSEGANMLRFVDAAARVFLSGRQPYGELFDFLGGVPCCYMPALWLPYVPQVAFGLDLRLFNLLSLLILVVLFEGGFRTRPGAALLSVTFYPLVLSSTVATMIVHGHLWPFWIVLCAAMLLLIKGRLALAALLFGFSLAARQPALVFVAPLAAYLWSQVGMRKTLIYSSIALGTYLAIVLPFALSTGAVFWEDQYFNLAKYIAMGDQDPQIGAAALLNLIGWVVPGVYLQVAVLCLAILMVLGRPEKNSEWFVFTVGAFYTWIVFFAFYSIRYEYFAGLFLMSMGVTSLLASRSPGRGAKRA